MATTRSNNFFNQYDIRRYVDESNFAVIMDTANQKYNGAAWRKLGNWDTPRVRRLCPSWLAPACFLPTA